MIENEVQLKNAVDKVSELLQDIQTYIEKQGAHPRQGLRNGIVSFPRGFLRTAAQGRSYFSFIQNEQLQSNLAYTMILSDTIHWLLARTDISGIARQMLIKLQLFLGGAIVESVTKSVLKESYKGTYVERLEHLQRQQIIPTDLKDKLVWLWDMRNKMHLEGINSSEYHSNEYTAESLYKAVVAVRGLCECLSNNDVVKTPGTCDVA